MKGPIAYALGAPDRTAHATSAVDWSAAQAWNFTPVDNARFPAIDLARHCGIRGGGLPAVFNAANEVAVAAFMNGDLDFSAIVEIVASTTAKLDSIADSTMRDLSDVSGIEEDARTVARALVVEKK